MDIITKHANKFNQLYFRGQITKYEEIIDSSREQLVEIDDHLDKIKFLNIILEGNNQVYEEHKPKCKDPDKCAINFAHESIAYFLIQELGRLGVSLNDDTFSVEEKESADSKLDKILKDLDELKTGHQIIYDDLKQELDELKDLFFLGKKKWHQLFMGKCLEMVASGIISETLSKEIVTAIEPTFNKIINQ